MKDIGIFTENSNISPQNEAICVHLILSDARTFDFAFSRKINTRSPKIKTNKQILLTFLDFMLNLIKLC